jgi:hypothetical protein
LLFVVIRRQAFVDILLRYGAPWHLHDANAAAPLARRDKERSLNPEAVVANDAQP